jgi:glycosyltransferase involved in cell wall biosynthesis
MPNVYLLHGELTEKEMNTLYNHPKVKVHISLTKGEGFGRPLLEASVSGKPVIASGWSGHLDFLDKERAMLIGGELKPVHESVVWKDIIIKEATWFSPDVGQAMNGMAAVAMNYNDYKSKAYDLAVENRKKFSYEAIKERTFELLDQYVPEFPKDVEIVLPKLNKAE